MAPQDSFVFYWTCRFEFAVLSVIFYAGKKLSPSWAMETIKTLPMGGLNGQQKVKWCKSMHVILLKKGI